MLGEHRTSPASASVAVQARSQLLWILLQRMVRRFAVEECVRRTRRLDVLINCAAAAPAEAFLEMTAEAWELALRVNVRAVALAMAAAAREMTRNGGGRIVNVTSAAARMALPHYAAYAATKAAVDSLTRSAAVALAKQGIRVNSISPGMMDTPLQVRTEETFCRLEGRSDLLISTLQSYIEAMGGSLKLVVEFPDGRAVLSNLGAMEDKVKKPASRTKRTATR